MQELTMSRETMSDRSINYIRLGSVDDFRQGQGRVVSAARKPVAVFNVRGEFFAVNNICPHMGGPIAAGDVDGMEVICPYHGMRFDLRTGQSADVFGHSLQTYNVKVERGQVLIEVWWAKRKE